MTALRVTGALLLTAGVSYLGYGVDRTDLYSFLPAFGLAFLGYFAIIFRPPIGRFVPYLAVGIVLRVLLVFAFPLLSDDVYRFIWDGQLIVTGHNPFLHLPGYYLEEGQRVAGLTPELFARLNSPDYHTIYPPVAQGIFTVAAWLSPRSWYGAAVVMKLFLLLAELGTLWLLYRLLLHFGLPPARLLLYWLNPLVIVEIVGNLHFEGAMIFFLLGSLWLLTRGRYGAAAGAMSLAVASKLLPLMLLPLLLRRLWRGQFWRYAVVFGVTTLLLFLPLLLGSGFVDGFGESLALYFQKFEFNASLYYLLRAYGFYELGWNQIDRFGPLLARVTVVAILLLAYLSRSTDWRRLPELWMWAFVIYLVCATTVHPWYLAVPLALGCFTPWRFPYAWSCLIVLTYASYASDPYRENLWLVGLEYGVVAILVLAERSSLQKQRPARKSRRP